MGTIWYSPALFAKQWMKLVDKKEKDLQKGANVAYATATVGFLLIAYVMAHFIDYADSTTFATGLETGLWLWLGFVATTFAINTTFSDRPKQLWVIDAGYYFVCFLLTGAVLAVWV